MVRCQLCGEVPNLSVGCVKVCSSGLRRDGRGRFRRPRLAPDSSTGSRCLRGSSGTASSQSQSSLRRKGDCCFEGLCPTFKLRFNRDHGARASARAHFSNLPSRAWLGGVGGPTRRRLVTEKPGHPPARGCHGSPAGKIGLPAWAGLPVPPPGYTGSPAFCWGGPAGPAEPG